jgi:hypothetical protein
VIGLLLSLLAAAPAETPGAYSLADCGFRKIDVAASNVEGQTLPFALLFRTGGKDGRYIDAADLRVFDPADMLMDLPLLGGFYTEDGKMLALLTDDRLPAHFEMAFSFRRKTKKWVGAMGRHGAGTADQHMAHSYMGECTITQPADAVARFEALGAGR